jgi:hypothetical protein
MRNRSFTPKLWVLVRLFLFLLSQGHYSSEKLTDAALIVIEDLLSKMKTKKILRDISFSLHAAKLFNCWSNRDQYVKAKLINNFLTFLQHQKCIRSNLKSLIKNEAQQSV